MPPKTVRIVVAGVLAAIGVGALVAIATAAGRGNASVAEYQYPAGAAGPANGQNAGKITICHRTHSSKKPWVRITISVNAWPAHARHGDSQDLSKCGGALTPTSKKNGNGNPGKGNPHEGNGAEGPGHSQGHGHGKP